MPAFYDARVGFWCHQFASVFKLILKKKNNLNEVRIPYYTVMIHQQVECTAQGFLTMYFRANSLWFLNNKHAIDLRW